MSVAAKTTDGKIFVETIDCCSIRSGNSWILSYLNDMKKKTDVDVYKRQDGM